MFPKPDQFQSCRNGSPPHFSKRAFPLRLSRSAWRKHPCYCCLGFDKSVISLILSHDMSELSAVTSGVIEQLSRLDGKITVLDGSELLDKSPDMGFEYLKTDFAGRAEALFQEMVRRNNTYKQAVAKGGPVESYSPEYFVITGLQTILASLSDQGKDEVNTLMEKAELHYNIRFVLCESAKAMSEFVGTAWYKRHISGSEGIWVGDGIADQYTFENGKLTSSLYSELPPALWLSC